MNADHLREQIRTLGFSYDWDCEMSTTDPSYYKWTQWTFLKLYDKGSAYVGEVPVSWCSELGTVLANEEVIDSKSEHGDFPAIRKPICQRVLETTEYAECPLEDFELCN